MTEARGNWLRTKDKSQNTRWQCKYCNAIKRKYSRYCPNCGKAMLDKSIEEEHEKLLKLEKDLDAAVFYKDADKKGTIPDRIHKVLFYGDIHFPSDEEEIEDNKDSHDEIEDEGMDNTKQ